MTETYDVMAAGHVCIDIIPDLPDTGAAVIGDLLRPGTLVEVGAVTINTGGPVSNTGIALQRLGNRVCFSTRVGDDAFGQMTLDLLAKSGNVDGVRVVSGSPSSYTVALAPPGIDRTFLHNRGTNNTYGADDLDPDQIARCRVFHFGYPPLMKRLLTNDGEELERVFRTAKEAGAITSCDMSLPAPATEAGRLPWRTILERILPNVDLFLPSIEEAFYMLDPGAFVARKEEHDHADLIDVIGPDEYAAMADALLAMGPKVVALKSGHKGYYLRTGDDAWLDAHGAAEAASGNWRNRELWCPAFCVPNLVSATGSGDSSIAGFLAAFLRGLSIETAVKTATCLGWQNLQVLDAVTGILSWDETVAFLDRGMPLIDVNLEGTEWTWCEATGLWTSPRDSGDL
ncbi:MAG: carbohydrate kinase family protein [bacterium]|nr:carbohydrate kinase family protein [bacterium]